MDSSPEELWKERFHYTEEESMLIADARFEQKPFFTLKDILERPFAGGVSAFSAISDNYYMPELEGVKLDQGKGLITTNTLMINSLGVVEHWRLTFRCKKGLEATAKKMSSPKSAAREMAKGKIEDKIKEMSQDPTMRFRLKYFFVNEYYPAIIHSGGKMVVLEQSLKNIIADGTMHDYDLDIVRATMKAVPEWFTAAV
jgi:hypothetical protein